MLPHFKGSPGIVAPLDLKKKHVRIDWSPEDATPDVSSEGFFKEGASSTKKGNSIG